MICSSDADYSYDNDNIQRANFDGTGIEELVVLTPSDTPHPFGVAVTPEPGTLSLLALGGLALLRRRRRRQLSRRTA